MIDTAKFPMQKFRTLALVNIISSFVFALLTINISNDISLLAFPVSALISLGSAYFLYKRVVENDDYDGFAPCVKFLQYLPYALLLAFILRRAGHNGTPYWYDIITVLLWCTVMVSRWILLFFFNEKRIYKINEPWLALKEKKVKSSFDARWLFFEALDWIDALLQAVFMVLLIQIFILQLYVIPSESMVPSFLIGDRVVVFKTPSGPDFPLSDVGLPCIKDYKRGDVVVFRNPHYSMNRKSEVRTVVSQIVYMLTFTFVNLNVDDQGEPKADPLVKRICGLPGEQIVMQDGVLYARTKDSDEYKKMELDNKFAAWDLNSLSSDFQKGIKDIPLRPHQYSTLLEVEELRRNFSLEKAIKECRRLNSNVLSIYKACGKDNGKPYETSLNQYTVLAGAFDTASEILTNRSALSWYSGFMTDWIKNESKAVSDMDNDIYAMANYKLNIMIKCCFGRIVSQTVTLLSEGKNMNDLMMDEIIKENLSLAEKLNFYVLALDQRNMPVFPPCTKDGKPQYINEDCYFMMGDNRFNSLDMRHSYDRCTRPLTAFDSYSVQYVSNMEQRSVNKKYILGSAVYRFWPTSRKGFIETK